MDGSAPVGSGSRDVKINSDLKNVLKMHQKALIEQLTEFTRKQGLIGPSEEFFCPEPHQDSAEIIVAWILSVYVHLTYTCGPSPDIVKLLMSYRCGSINLDGSIKPSSEERRMYTHAQKMRAAATFGLGQVCGLRNCAWERSEVTGRMTGNLSVSQ
ncbi:hypothetical protein AAF712_015384 [Marasmius tenuissimus]|uniref:Uncharacterized protein n=1 Tax=Marasmius tenuissimus TaxID=585030 RepID=A0ABR2Z8N6_9AGAR